MSLFAAVADYLLANCNAKTEIIFNSNRDSRLNKQTCVTAMM